MDPTLGVLLAVDIGNTNVKFGAFRGDAIFANWRLSTSSQRTTDEYGALLTPLLQRAGIKFTDIRGVSLSSSVPNVVPAFREFVSQYLGRDAPYVQVAPGMKTGVAITIENPREMGADRIVNALAALRLYRVPAIVIDFGTATTFDAIDAQGRLLGTAIAPGFMTAMEGLFQQAAKLTRIEIERPTAAIGRSTVAALRSGWVYGYAGLVEGMVRRICQELGGNPIVIATGGLAPEVLAETNVVDVHDPFLTLQGLRLFFDLNHPTGP